MSDAGATLARVEAALRAAGVPHMVVGSFASSMHGEPRTTQDLDVVVAPDGESLARLLAQLPESDWYVDAETASDAVRRRSMFNVVDLATGWKVDLIVRKATAFAECEFGRRVETEILGVRTWVATAEDTLLAKLVWAKAGGGSERQLRDVAGILAAAGASLDRSYVDGWAGDLGVGDLWRTVADATS